VRIPNNPDDTNDKVYTVLQPDICVLCKESGQYSPKNGWVGIPDLVVEIVSPSTLKRDLGEKKDIYEEALVKEYWVVFPLERTVFLYELKNEKYQNFQVFTTGDTIYSILFPEFSIKIDDIFAKIDNWA
jgi:Uma2 family endonuclease